MQPNDIAIQKAIADLDAKWRQRFQEAANDLMLRKWCVEQVVKISCPDVEAVWSAMYRFLVEPFAASPPAD